MRPDRAYNSSSWTKEEDKAFEKALAVYFGDSNVVLNIAAAVPRKSTQEIIKHYNVLVEDINSIESGIVPLPKYRRMQSSNVQRRKGIPWTPEEHRLEEHRLFLQGFAKHGQGDWQGISRNFVLSRTPTQVASHAQKFFRRLKDNDNGKRRRSIHDITSAADITEPSHGQKTDELKGPCGGQLQWPIPDYVTKAFDTGMLSSPGPVANCTTDAIEGQSAVNPEKFPLGAALGSEWNSSFPGMDEFLQSIKDQIVVPSEGISGVCGGVDTRTSQSLSLQPSVAGGTAMYTFPVSFPNVDEFLRDIEDRITVPAKGTSEALLGVGTRTFASHSLQPSVSGGTRIYTHPIIVSAEGTSGARSGVDTWTSPSLSLQPSVAGGTGMYTHPVNNVRYDLEELMTKQLVGTSQVGPTVNDACFPLPIADHIGVHGCTASSSGNKNGFMSTIGASEGGFSFNSMQLPSIPVSSGGGTFPCWYPSSKDENIFDLEDLFPDHIFGFGK